MRMHGRCPALAALAISGLLLAGCDLGVERTVEMTKGPVPQVSGDAAGAVTAEPAAAPAPGAGVRHVDPAGAARLLKENPKVIVLDVRTPEEYADGHIGGATNLNFNAKGFETSVAALDRQATYLVHCAVGGRSKRTLPVLERLGFKSVVHLDGGFEAWKDAGNPVSK